MNRLKSLQEIYRSIRDHLNSDTTSRETIVQLKELFQESNQIINDIKQRYQELNSDYEKLIKDYEKTEVRTTKRRESISSNDDDEYLNVIDYSRKRNVQQNNNINGKQVDSNNIAHQPNQVKKQVKSCNKIQQQQKSPLSFDDNDDDDSFIQYQQLQDESKIKIELKRKEEKEIRDQIKKKNESIKMKKKAANRINENKSNTFSKSKASIKSNASSSGSIKKIVKKSTPNSITPSYPKIVRKDSDFFPDYDTQLKQFSVYDKKDNSDSGSDSESGSDSGSDQYDSESEDERAKYRSNRPKHFNNY